MPIYEYVCQDCNEKYEKLVRSFNTKIELTCPNCGSHHAEKALSVFGSLRSDSPSSSSSNNFGSTTTACGPVG